MLDTPALNAMLAEEFVGVLDGVLERAPWVAEAAAMARPYADPTALHAGLMTVLRAAPEDRLLAFLNGHPDLTAGALAPDLTEASRVEQGASGLAAVIGEEDLEAMLRDYRARHGIPFIVALRRRTPESVVRALSERLGRPTSEERETALREVGHVSRLRLFDRLSDAPRPTGALILSPRMDEDVPKGATRVVLMQENRPAWNGQPDRKRPTTLLSGEELREGHYVLAVEGWAENALPRGAALRFAVRDPARRVTVTLRVTPNGIGLRVAA